MSSTTRNRAPDRRELITLKEAADLCRVNVKTVRRMIADKQITGYRLRGSIRVDRNELERLGQVVTVIDPDRFVA